jgi:hypothetical protein
VVGARLVRWEGKSITDDLYGRIMLAARDEAPVSGYTHNYYRYPARFSPKFVRAVIDAFTEPGDFVLDPFMGGGTTLVEALAHGRNAMGIDISSLAVFVSRVKTTLLSPEELGIIQEWAWGLFEHVNMRVSATQFEEYERKGYCRHLDSAKTWRLRRAIEQALVATNSLKSRRLEAFARCIVLRTAQWALDGRKKLPTFADFRDSLVNHAERMIAGAHSLREQATANGRHASSSAVCLLRSAIGLEQDPHIRAQTKPKLVLTSPPYPGIHVLYHRWQVDGRKETPAPFWIADQLDGAGPAYYTMGDRRAVDQKRYFDQLHAALCSIRRVSTESTIVVQVLAFSKPALQLPLYLKMCEKAGFAEVCLPNLACEGDGRLRRNVPNRKWHADQLGTIPASREIVLFHRLLP